MGTRYSDAFRQQNIVAIAYPTMPFPAPPLPTEGDALPPTFEVGGRQYPDTAILRNALPGPAFRAPALSIPARRHQFNGRRQAAADVLRRSFAIGANRPISRRDKDREQPSSKSPLTRHRKIQLALALPFEERLGRVRAAAPVKTQQDVIVAVEDRYAPRRCHQRCSVAESFKMRPLPDRSLGVPFRRVRM
jgi:hypothetical protein